MNAEVACYEYVNVVRDFASLPLGFYGKEKYRTEAHDKLCKMFGLSKESTKKYTDNLDLDNPRVAENLYFALLDESRKVRSKTNE